MNRFLKVIILIAFLLISCTSLAVYAVDQEVTVYEQNNSALTYTGSWSNIWDSSASGSYYKAENGKDAAVSLDFSGTGIKWIAMLSTNSGIAEVILDGKTECTIDLYSSQKNDQQIVFQKQHLDRGNHTLKIRVTGNKSGASNGAYVNVDCFKVVDSADTNQPDMPVIQQVVNLDKSVGLIWKANTDADLEGYNIYRSLSPTAGFFKINPWIYLNGSSYVDNTVNNGITYYYYVTAVDSKGNESVPSQVVSAIPANYPGSYEENDRGVALGGTWYTDSNGNESGDRAYYSNTAGNTADLAFYGTGIRLTGYKGSNCGTVEITLDKGLATEEVQTVDMYLAAGQYQQVMYEKTGLGEGVHTVSIKVTGQRNTSSSNTYIFVDAFKVYGTTHAAGKVEDNSVTIDYTGVWSRETNGNYSGGSVAYTQRTGATATYSFYGTGVEVLAITSTDYGMARISIDAEPASLIDCYSPSTIYQKRIYKRYGLNSGKHTIKIEVTGTKSASSNGVYVSLDGINVIQPVTSSAVPANSTAVEGKGSISLSWDNAGNGVVGYNVYRYRGIIFDGLVNKGLVRTTAFTDSGLTAGVQYTYEVTAVDTLGNESATSTRVSGIPAVMGAGESVPVGTNILAAGTYEEDNAAIVYTGSWGRSWSSDSSGSYYMASSTEGNKAVLNFKGTGIKWTANRYNSCGTAEVLIDGRPEGVTSLYNSSAEYKQTVYQRMNLANGWHTMEIRVLEKGQINIDTITIVETDDVTAPLAPSAVSTEKGNTTIDISWAANGESDLEGYRIYRSTKPDSGFIAVGQSALKLVKGALQYTDTSLINGTTYYYLVTAVDKYGNESLPSQVVGEIPAALDGKHQEDDVGFQFTGTWNRSWDGNADGSSYIYNNTAGSTATFVFYGTGVKLAGLRATNYGIADITVKDLAGNTVKTASVDLWSQSTIMQFEMFHIYNLEKGIYSVEVKVSGTKNGNSSNTYVGIDSFEVTSLSDDTIPDAPGGLSAVSGNKAVELTWNMVDADDLSGYNIVRSTAPGGEYTKVNTFTVTGATTYTDTSVINGLTYYYKVSALDKFDNESAASQVVSAIPANCPESYEENDIGVALGGTWNIDANGNHSGGRAYYSNTAGNTACLAFYGTGIRLTGYKGSNCGTVEITLDKGLATEDVQTVDMYSAAGQYRQVMYEKTGLGEGVHTVSIKVTGQRNTSSSSTYIFVDTFKVYGTTYTAGKVEDNSATIDYTGVWSRGTDGNYSGGNVAYTERTGAAVTYPFYGTGVEVLATISTNYGMARISIDGEPAALIDCYSPSTIYQKKIYKRYGLNSGKHTIKIEVTGTKSASSNGVYVALDGINVIEPVTSSAVPANIAAVEGSGSISLSWDNAGNGVVGYNVYRYRGIIFDGLVNKGLVRTTAFTDSGLTAGVQYTYEVTAVDTLGNESATSTRVSGIPAVMGAGESVPVGTNILTAGTYEENNAAIVYTGSWGRSWGSETSGSYYMASSTEGNKAVLNFKGTGIKWTANRYNSCGTAEVLIDGRPEGVTSLYNSSAEYKQTVYQRMNLANGWHTMEIRVLEKGQINIDTITIVETDDVTAPLAPSAVSTEKGNTTIDISWAANGESDLEGYRVYRSTKPDCGFIAVGQSALKLVRGALQYTDKSLINGNTYYYVVTAVDKYGNESLPSQIVNEIPAALEGKHQDDDAGFQFTAAWNRAWDGNADGSYYIYSNSAGNTATLFFYGTGVKLTGLRASNYGIADITVKDLAGNTVKTASVDLWSQSKIMQFEMFHIYNLEKGIYALEVKVSGRKNGNSSDTYVGIDSFEVTCLSDDTIPDAPGGLSAVSGDKAVELTWNMVNADDLSGYNIVRSTAPGGEYTRVNTFTLTGATTYTDTSITNGLTYYYKVSAIDKFDNESVFSQAAKAIPANYPGSYEENDSGVVLGGSWNINHDGNASGSRMYYSNTAGNTADLAFYGTGIRLTGYKGSDCGTVEITLDKGLATEEVQTVDMYSAVGQYQQVMYEKIGLGEGVHTVSIKVTGQKNTSSAYTHIFVDAFKVYGTTYTAGKVEDNSLTIGYTGVWSWETNGNYSEGSVAYTERTGSEVTYSFYGTGVEVLATTSTNYGMARVSIDGEPSALIDCYSPSTIYQKKVYKRYGLSSGKHTIKIEVTGTKSASSNGFYVALDGINVIEPVTSSAVPANSAAVEGSGSISLSWDNAGNGVVGYNVYRYRGIIFDGLVNKGLVRTTAFTDSGLTAGVQYTYEVTAVDTLGNESAASAKVNSIPAVMGAGENVPEGTNILTTGTYEENNPAIVYTGSWGRSWSSESSGSYYMQSSTEGNKAVLNFKGTGIKWTANRYNSCGTAEVWIDGKLEEVSSLYSSSTEYKQTVYQRMNLANGWHTLEIRVLEKGQVNIDTIAIVETDDVIAPLAPSAVSTEKGNTTIDISWAANGESDLEGYRVYRSTKPDSGFIAIGQSALKLVKSALQYTDTSLINGTTYYYLVTAVDKYGNESLPSQVVGEMPAALEGKHQEDDVGFQFTGTWNKAWDGKADGSCFIYNNTAGSTASFVFYGTGVKWMAFTGTNYGKAEVFIDDILKGTVDLYRQQNSNQNIVWFSSPPLGLGTHKITIRNTGGKNTASSGNFITIDSLEVLNSSDIMAPSVPQGLTVLYNPNENCLQWYEVDDTDLYGYHVYRSTTGKDDSYTRITIDPVRFSSAYLDSTLTSPAYYRVTSFDINGNESLPSTAVLAVPTAASNVTVEENNPLIAYTGVWNRSSDSNASGGYLNYTSDKPVKATYTFYGTGIDLISRTSYSAGAVLIKVDGGSYVKVDLYSQSEEARKTVYRLRNLPLGLHTVEISDAGANINSSGSTIYIDALRIVDGNTDIPLVPGDVGTAVLVNKVRLMWSNTEDPDVIGYNVYYRYGALEYKKANLAGPVQSGFTHTGLSLASTYYYVVKAVDSLGNESDASIEVSALTSDTYIKACLQPSYSVVKEDSLTISGENSYTTDMPLSYYWDLDGDGQYDDAEGIKTTVKFQNTGEYTIGLKVVDSLARIDTTTSKVIVTVPADKTPPTAPTNLTVVTRTGSAVMVSWAASTDDIGVTAYEIFRNGESIGTATITSYTDMGVAADTTYTYYVKALDASGKISASSNTVSATPKMPHITSIDPISGSAVGGKTTKTLKVYFADYGGIIGSHAAFEYSLDGQKWTPVDGTINGPYRQDATTLYFSTGLDTAGMVSGNYSIRYSVFDGSDNVDREVAALKIDLTAPGAPKNIICTPKVGGVDISWQPTGDDDVSYYNVYRSETENGNYTKIAKVVGVSKTNYSDNTVKVGVTAYYKVTAVDRFEQEGSYSAIVSGAPSVDDVDPVILGMEPLDGTVIGPDASITVRAEDNLSLSKIILQYSLDKVNWIDIEARFTKDNATFKWATSPLNGTVYVRAIAVDSVGNQSDGSTIVCYSVDNQGPDKVNDLIGTPLINSITLHWKFIPGNDFSHFVVERKDSEAGAFKVIGRVETALGMNVTGLNAETIYWFKVTAYDKYGNRGISSDEAIIATLKDYIKPSISSLGPAPGYYAQKIPLTATAYDNQGIKEFTFQVSTDLTNWTDVVTLEALNTPMYYYASYSLDVSGIAEGPLYVRGIAKDTDGNESNKTETAKYAEYRIDRTPPAVPTGVQTQSNTGDITITWEQGIEVDLAAYRVYRSEGGSDYKTIADKVSSTAYRDRAVVPGQAYSYKVSAIDAAGNVSAMSSMAEGQLLDDTEAPSILSVSPDSKTEIPTVPANTNISALAADNYKLASVKMEFIKNGDENAVWKLIGSQKLSVYSQVVTMTWNTAGLTDGNYTIRITAVDEKGLQSAPRDITVNLNADPPAAPVLKGTAGGWKASLSWTSGNESDLAGFRVYKSSSSGSSYRLVKETTGTTYEEQGLEPGINVFYVVDAVDIYGNVSRSNEVDIIPTNEDVNPPSAKAGKDVEAATGIPVWFDGTLSTDNDRIAGFEWDFGDGSKSVEAQPTHIYNTNGQFTVTLTVTDPSGNKNTDSLVVTVVPPIQVGNIEIKAVDESTGLGLPGASIVVQYPDGTSKDVVANGQGIATVVAAPGDCKVFAYKTDYLPSSGDVKVSANQKSAVTLKLKKGQLVVGDLTVRRLTLDEIKDAGIDATAPENQHVYKFEVHLAFNNIPLPPADIIVNQQGQITPGTYKPIIIKDTSPGSTRPGTYIAYPVAIPNVKHPEVRPTLAYMVIPGEARFLKEFFEVGLSLENAADPEFVIEDSKATLKLPTGLSLAPTREEQRLVVDIGAFAGGEKRQVKWIIRGDEKGSYNLEADFTGTLQPFGDPVKATFKTKEPFKVWGDDALMMHVIAQDNTAVGHPYYVRFELENVSDIPVYYPSIELIENGKQNYFYAPNQELINTVRELPAGQKLVKEYTLISAINGELDLTKSYVLRTGGNGTVKSDIQKISVPQNYMGTAPVLTEVQNSNGTVTLTWGAVQNALGYKIYSIRKDLIMSVDPSQLIAHVDSSVNTYTIDEGGIKKDYIITTIMPEGEITRHAIKWPYGVDPAPAVVTVDPMKVYTNTESELLITVNQDGLPVVNGTVDVGSFATGVVLDGNGQARVKIKPLVAGDILIDVYNKGHQWLASTKITAEDKPIKLYVIGNLDNPKKGQVLTADKYTINGWFLDPKGVSKIEVLVDDAVVGEAIYGDSRPDVMNAYPAYNNNNAGYHYILDLKLVSPGSHTIKIRETGNDGGKTTLPVKAFVRQLIIRGSLDSVVNNQTLSGKYNISGWILDSLGVSRIEVLVDGLVVGEAAYGIPRPDVKKVYPEYNIENSGFNFILDTRALSDGSHKITIRKTGTNGTLFLLPDRTIKVSNKLAAIGFLDTPKANVTISGAYPIAGWFLDPSVVSKIEVLVDGAVVGEAIYGKPRADVLKVYPDYKNVNSGFVYLLDTTQLSVGSHTITIQETGMDGNKKTLTPQTFTVSHSNQLKPVGYIDKPKGSTALGGKVTVSGWVLDIKGVSRVEILIDSKVAGEAVYGDSRKDVMELFPNYANNNSGFHYLLDTSLLSNGKHTITIRETNADSISNDIKSMEIIVSN